VSTAGHRKLSASLWSLYTGAVFVCGVSQALWSPGTPDVTPLQLFALILFGRAAITSFCFALGQHWAHATMRVLTPIFIIFVGLVLGTTPREIPRFPPSLVQLLGMIIVTGAFLIGLYACIVSWRTPLRTKEV